MSYQGKGKVKTILTSNANNYEANFSSFFPYHSGKYYTFIPNDNAIHKNVPSSDLILAFPVVITDTVNIDRVGIYVATAASAGKSVAIGLYNTDGKTATTLYKDFGTVSTDATGWRDISINEEIISGIYFFALNFEEVCTIRTSLINQTILPNSDVRTDRANGCLRYSQTFSSGFPDLTSDPFTLASTVTLPDFNTTPTVRFRVP